MTRSCLFDRVADELVTDDQYRPVPHSESRKTARHAEKEEMIALERRHVLQQNEDQRGLR